MVARLNSSTRMSFPRDPFRLGLFALTILTMSRVHQHFAFLNPARPALLLFLFCVGYLVINPRTLRSAPGLMSRPAKIVFLLAILSAVSVPFGMSMGNSAAYILESYSKVIVFAFLLFIAIRRSGDLLFYIWAFVISSAILSYFALFVFDATQQGSAVERIHDLYTYDSNDLGVILVVALPLAMMLFQTSASRLGRVFSGLVIVGIGMSAAVSGSRGTFLGLAVVGLALLVMVDQVSLGKRVAFLTVLIVALGVSAPPGYWNQMSTLRQPTEDYNWDSSYGRRKIWLRGLGYMAENPLTGIGIDNFGRAEGTVSDPALRVKQGTGGRTKWSAAHNSFIQIGAELGVFGLVAFSFLVFGSIASLRGLRRRLPRYWQHGDPEQRMLSAALLYLPISIVGFAVTASFVSFAYTDTIYVLSAFCAGVHIAVAARLKLDSTAISSANRGPGSIDQVLGVERSVKSAPQDKVLVGFER
jgi:O-antigen ligase